MAHVNFIDRDRRLLNLRQPQVEGILPEHFRALYPKFISLLERYYEFQDENDSTELLNHLFASRDINETDITLLTYIEDELLLGETYFKGFGNNDTELRAAANFSNILFRSKGSKFAIEWFFRSFFGQDVEVIYTKENIFNVGEAPSQLGSNSLKYLTDDKLYQTFAILIRVGIPISRWREAFKLFAHPAGMYLAGEFFSVDEVSTEPLLDEIIEQYTNPEYTVTIDQPAGPIDEGTSIGFTVNVENVPGDGNTALYWWGEHIDTNDSDFGVNFFDGSTGLPDSDNRRYFDVDYQPIILASSGNFSVDTIIDAAESPAEGAEDFKIYIGDKSGRTVYEQTITLTDLVPNWNITGDTTVNEGDVCTLNISATNPPYDGNITLRWYLDTADGANTVDNNADFTSPLPLVGSPEEVEIVANSGSISFTPIIDGVTDGPETAVIKFLNPNNVVVATQNVIINDQAASIALTVNGGTDITEGVLAFANVVVGAYAEGISYTYDITGAIAGDGRISQLTGSGTYSHNAGGGINIPIASTVSDVAEGTVAGVFEFNLTLPGGTVQETQAFNVIDEAPTYEMVVTPAFAGQGDTVTYTLNTTNVADATDVFLDIDYGTADAADFTTAVPGEDGNPRETVTITGNTGSTTLQYAAAIADDQSYQAKYFDALTGGTELGSTDLTIVGSNNQAAITASDTTPDEGTTLTLDVVGTDGSGVATADGTYKFWFNPNPSNGPIADDFTNVRVNGAFVTNSIAFTSLNKYDVVVTNGTAQIEIDIVADQTREENEQFTVALGSPAVNNPAVADTGIITIQDTSVATYSVANYTSVAGTTVASTVSEADDLFIGVTAVGGGSETALYVELSGAGASEYSSQQKTIANPAIPGLSFVSFTAPGDDGIVDGARAVTITVRLDSHVGPTVATTTISLDDTNTDPTATLTAFASGANRTAGTPTTTTFDEGDTIFFTVDTTNISDTNEVRYMPDDVIYSQATWSNVTSVLSFPYDVESEGDIQVGMVARGSTGGYIDGLTVQSISGAFVTMSGTPSNPTVPTSQYAYFAQPEVWNQYANSGDDAYGTATISGGTADFDVVTTELTSSLVDETYTWNVFDHQDVLTWPAVPITTAGLTTTLTNVTTGISPAFDGTGGTDNYNRLSTQGSALNVVQHRITFRFTNVSTGVSAYRIFAKTYFQQGAIIVLNQQETLGTWIADADIASEPDVTDYEFRFDTTYDTTGTGASSIGGWNTWTDMDVDGTSTTALEFGVQLDGFGFVPDSGFGSLSGTLRIRRKNSTDEVTQNVTIFISTYDAGGGGSQ